ncbi:uncharacterized protein BDZ99DRAFT_505466 [Mytilinidion resinicola]|uniref:Anaphase-promoting complex subunit 4 n=1 Tax=Mytilinidion resinicola TaxID=574789 RepID=A0A6A6Z660_9PEZI|nr:uncharacterized protein BDZ99DRAFT_505466 [Mytilinidion resinicola]KAF2815774.1 hypothetical protein BDZ99DRAFT_505466 [Mytilinidion resinicola]
MESPQPPILLLHAEKTLLHPVKPHLLTYCPTMDLVATVSEEEEVDVWRISGQRAFGVKRKGMAEVERVCWKFNGQAIAVAWSDGTVDVISAETGKFLLKDSTTVHGSQEKAGKSQAKVACLGWGVNFIDVDAVKARTGISTKASKQRSEDGPLSINISSNGDGKGLLTTEDWDSFRDDTTLDDFLQRQPDLSNLDISPDLPDQLAMMDVESLLPKLPVIPVPPANPFARPAAGDTGAFSSQAQIDGIFHSHHLKDHNAVDVLVRCMDDGTISPTIYDSLSTVSVGLPAAWQVEKTRPLVHASHPYSCSHGLLIEITSRNTTSSRSSIESDTRLVLVPLTLRFISSAGIYLHLIASKTTQLQNLLQYVAQCLQRMRAFWTHAQDLPARFMRNISETLEEKGEGTLEQALYHLAVTGSCPATLKEWLVEELAESGHKRWDHAAITGLTKLLDLIHTSLLPALDRCSIVTSTLRGLARYHDESFSRLFSIPLPVFGAILDSIRSVRFLAHSVLIATGDEKRQFAAFSRWLRWEIDVRGAEGSREESDGERDPDIDYSLLLEYLQGPLRQSDVAPYLRPGTELAALASPPTTASEIGYDDTRKAVQAAKEGKVYKEEALSLELANERLKKVCGRLFEMIGKWQAESTGLGTGVVLEEGESRGADLRMVFEDFDGSNDITTYAAVLPKTNTNEIRLHRITHADVFDESPNSVRSCDTTTLQFGSGTVLDVKFADDAELIALVHVEDSSYLLSIPYNPNLPLIPSPSTSLQPLPPLPYHPLSSPTFFPAAPDQSQPNVPALDLSDPARLKPYIKHIFANDGFEPEEIVVNGRKDRRVVAVLEKARRRVRVLDLGYREDENKKREGDGGTEDVEDSESASDVDMMG